MLRALCASFCLFTATTMAAGCSATAAAGSGTNATADTASDDTGLGGADASSDAGAGTDGASVDSGPSIDNLPCPSGVASIVGEGQDMAPGGACIQCHNSGEGPTDLIAGTVFRNLVTVDGCNANAAGSPALPTSFTVEITDATGKVWTTKSSATSGNFRMSANALPGFALPYKARILDSAGGVRAMTKAQSSGDCNTCHTAAGLSGAPGRIVAP